MSTDVNEVIKEGIKSITERLAASGVSVNITDAQIEVISRGVTELVNVINESSLKKAAAAGKLAADSVTDVSIANAVLKAAADAEGKK